jgi:hypothetical protein
MRRVCLLGGAALLALATSAQARVTAIHIETRTTAPTKPGERPYEIITGTFDGDLSPSRDAIITDIGQAPAGKTVASAIARRLPSPAPWRAVPAYCSTTCPTGATAKWRPMKMATSA